MTLKITHKHGTTAGTPPAAGDIDVGELAINAADAEIYTKDTSGNVRKFQNTTTGTAAGVQFTQSGTGVVPRTVESKLQDVVSVKDFGAKGDGVTDDTAAIQASLVGYPNDPSTGRTVFFPEGTYRVTDTITVPDNCELVGANRMKSIISFEKADATMFVYVARVNNLPVGRFQIRHLTLDANKDTPAMGTATAVSCTHMHGSHFTDFEVTRFKTGLYLNTCYMCQFTSFYFRGYAIGFDAGINAIAGVGTRHCTFQGGIFGNIGTDFSGFDNIILSDIDCEPSMSPIIMGRESLVTRCRFERMNLNWGAETSPWILIDKDNNQFINNFFGQNGGSNLQPDQYLIKVNGDHNTVSLGPSFSWRPTKSVNFTVGSKGNKFLVESQMKAYQSTDGNAQYQVAFEPVVVDTEEESYIEYGGNKGGGTTLRVLKHDSNSNNNYDNITSSGLWENLLKYTDDVLTNVNNGDIVSTFTDPSAFGVPEWVADPYSDASVFRGTWQTSGNNESSLVFDVSKSIGVEGTYTLMYLSRSNSNIFSRVQITRDGVVLSMGNASDTYDDSRWRYHTLQVYLLAGDVVNSVSIGQKPAGGIDPTEDFYLLKPSFCYGMSAPYVATGSTSARKTF